jgi:hypothetical protein
VVALRRLGSLMLAMSLAWALACRRHGPGRMARGSRSKMENK